MAIDNRTDWKWLGTRALVALAIAGVVMGLCLKAAWQSTISDSHFAYAWAQNKKCIMETTGQVNNFRNMHNRLPKSLLEAEAPPGDYYRNWLAYSISGSKFTITSYGLDGKRGGEWADTDQSSDDPPAKKPPPLSFWYFVVSAMPWDQLITVVATGIATFLISFFMIRNPQISRKEIVGTAITFIVVIAATTFVGAVLTTFHTIRFIQEH